MRRLVLVAALAAIAAPASAQTYVSGGIGAAVTRSSSSSGEGYHFDGTDGEVLSWMLRAGTSITSLFGVELEFARDAKLDVDSNPIIYAQPLAGMTGISWSSTTPTVRVSGAPDALIFPTPQVETRLRTTTWNATAFVRRSIASRADLVFLGGVTISRVVQRSRFSYDPRVLAIRVSSDTETTDYGVGPIVGAEARIGMTGHLELTPGLRVQSLGNDLAGGIVLRPSVTLGWRF